MEFSAKSWSEMSADVVELIFLKLPEKYVLRAACSCKRWNSIVRSPSFIKSHDIQMRLASSISFIHKGSNYFLTNHDGKVKVQEAYDAYKLPILKSFSAEGECHHILSLEGVGGLFYALTGIGDEARILHYKLSLLEQDWQVTPGMHHRMLDPVAGVVKNLERGTYKIVLAGDTSDTGDEKDGLAVEMYDSQTNSWEVCQPLLLGDWVPSLYMTFAVHRGRILAYDTFAGFISEFDLNTKQWSKARIVQLPTDVQRSYLLSQPGGLCLVTTREATIEGRYMSLQAWTVDESTMQPTELLYTSSPPAAFQLWLSATKDWFSTAIVLCLLFAAHFMFWCQDFLTRTCNILHKTVMSADFHLRLFCKLGPPARGTGRPDCPESRPTFLISYYSLC